ncbi:MAG: hypothetical protein JW727_05540 [Candidatus Aenigmarchaeota archaeon]|nr:hypothetical protein [Candidatus Aenigmarchaeota archaeon]
MEEEFVTRYVLRDGKLVPFKVSKKEAFRDVAYILRRDKKFLEAMKNL